MKHYFLFILSIFIFLGCSSDDATAVDTNIDTLYTGTGTATVNECATSKQNASITSPNSTPMLVVLLSYSNIQTTSSLSTWAQKMFSKDAGSLNEYYGEISNSQFEFSEATECNGVASVTIDKNHPDTSVDSGLFSSNVHPDLALALTALDDRISFSIYDTNADGHIQPDELLVTFIMAGYEDAYEGNHVTNGIWAHQYCVDSTTAPLVDGVTIMNCTNAGNYALFGERHGVSNPHDATIGVIAHELGHSAFHLPDLYLGGGIGNFGLMGAGTWAYASSSEYAGQTPVHMNAWSKFKNGWVTPALTTSGVSLDMNETLSGSYNVIKIQKNATQYYLLENRNNTGYDRGLYMLPTNGTFDGGLAIWQIDTDMTTQAHIDANTVNADSTQQGVYMIDANAGGFINGTGGDEKALFYNPNVSSFADANITNISDRNSTMTLDIN